MAPRRAGKAAAHGTSIGFLAFQAASRRESRCDYPVTRSGPAASPPPAGPDRLLTAGRNRQPARCPLHAEHAPLPAPPGAPAAAAGGPGARRAPAGRAPGTAPPPAAPKPAATGHEAEARALDAALVNRITWGATPAELTRMRAMGPQRYLQAQLHPDPKAPCPPRRNSASTRCRSRARAPRTRTPSSAACARTPRMPAPVRSRRPSATPAPSRASAPTTPPAARSTARCTRPTSCRNR